MPPHPSSLLDFNAPPKFKLRSALLFLLSPFWMRIKLRPTLAKCDSLMAPQDADNAERAPACRPSAGHSVPQCRPVPAYGRALRTPVPSAGRAGLRPGTPCPSAGLRPALCSPNAGQCRPSAFGRHSVPLVQTSAGLASVSPMPRVTECTCRPVPHCRCRPSGLHQALVTYRV